MIPVRPMPPAVAQNSAGSDELVTVRTSPSGSRICSDRHVTGEAASYVVVLAVHVRGDRAADGHLPGSGRNRHEPPGGQPGDHELLQADAGLAGDQAGGRVQAR